eukprot:TRINITY_DN44081_c0_g1_i1.p1 TRINITY_DN44081_c0_g1~~TRINITY_DN44081_c0_g1_i1.p1  ORF type:complete len:596 (-),score=112.02 TRINITY_DN44081_c0_g1_i1:43-1662(-)
MARWDDPDSDASGNDEADREERLEREARTDWEQSQFGGGADGGEDDDDDDIRGSDSDTGCDGGSVAESEVVADLFAKRPRHQNSSVDSKHSIRRPSGDSTSGANDNHDEGGGIWDPVARLAPRKKRKKAFVATAAGASADFVLRGGGLHEVASTAGFPEGTVVCLHGLQKAPDLNGQTGTVEGPLDGATGRCPVLLGDGSVKSLRIDNLREVLTGAVVRLKGLQAAAQLNGRIGECGKLDLASGRYDVVMTAEASGAPPKRVKPANIEFVRRFVTPSQMLSTQRRPFSWKEALTQFRDRGQRAWAAQLALLRELRLPIPRFVPSDAVAAFAAEATIDRLGARRKLAEATVPADRMAVDVEGLLVCRVFAVCVERDACCPPDGPRDDDLGRLGLACDELVARGGGTPIYFLLPTLCVKELPCLRASSACAWPLYLHLCQALVCVESQYWQAKTWCRIDQLFAAELEKPIYLLPQGGCTAHKAAMKGVGDGNSGWLLSDLAEPAAFGTPTDGQVSHAEKHLVKSIASQLEHLNLQVVRYRL